MRDQSIWAANLFDRYKDSTGCTGTTPTSLPAQYAFHMSIIVEFGFCAACLWTPPKLCKYFHPICNSLSFLRLASSILSSVRWPSSSATYTESTTTDRASRQDKLLIPFGSLVSQPTNRHISCVSPKDTTAVLLH